MKAKKFIYTREFEGMPKESDFQIIEEELPAIKDGEFLTEAIFLSVDPYMRAYTKRLRTGQTMIGCQVAKIIESKNEKFPAGRYVVGQFGWTTHYISDGTPQDVTLYPPYIIDAQDDIPLSLHLGVLGRTGNSAYFGFLELCKPKPGETVVVNAAAGAVGNHVGQIAKIKGCTVVGIAGSEEKCQWLLEIGFDHVINYKTANLRTELARTAPKGVDCYFDNVGGEMSSVIMQHMNKYGRVSVCGSIADYNASATDVPKATVVTPSIVSQELTVTGFIVRTWLPRWKEGVLQNTQWIKSGKLKYKETISEGFENMPNAFIGIMSGDNIGKAVVKV